MAYLTFRIWDDSVGNPSPCRHEKCGKNIRWGETMKSKRMPIEADAVPVQTSHDPQTGRVIAIYSSADSHFAPGNCAGAEDFRSR